MSCATAPARSPALLIALMGESLDDEERQIFARLAAREREPLQRVEEFWAIIGRDRLNSVKSRAS